MVDDTFDKIYEKYLKINEYLLSAEFVKFEIDQMQKKYGSPFYNYRIIKTLFLEGKKSISEIEEYNFGFATKGMKSRWQAIYSKIKGSKDFKKEIMESLDGAKSNFNSKEASKAIESLFSSGKNSK